MRLKAALILAAIMRFLVPNLFQVGGLALIATGCFILAPFFGFIVTGVFVALIGWAFDGRK